MTENKSPAKTPSLLQPLLGLVMFMSLGGFWYGFYLTYQILRSCSGIQCVNASLPGLIALFSLILFLTVIRVVVLSKKVFTGIKADLFTAGCAATAALLPLLVIWGMQAARS